MNSYHNQCRRGPGRGECRVPEVTREKVSCTMPEVAREKGCCTMPEMAREKGCCTMPEMTREKKSCHMHHDERWPVGMTYVPMQAWRELYQPDEGFHKGTIFRELDLPFLGRRMC